MCISYYYYNNCRAVPVMLVLSWWAAEVFSSVHPSVSFNNYNNNNNNNDNNDSSNKNVNHNDNDNNDNNDNNNNNHNVDDNYMFPVRRVGVYRDHSMIPG